jgi:hypothetical protein
MTLTASQIGWGSYQTYEGPFFRGIKKFVLPQNADETDKIIAVIAAAEGGCYDSINMYDRGIVSVGLIQWIEAGQRSVSDMIGCVAEKCGLDYVLLALKPALQASKATFKKLPTNKWRFVLQNGQVVDNDSAAKTLFLGCNGQQGAWEDNTKIYAKTWAASIANIWIGDEACKVQSEYTRQRLMSFVRTEAKHILFDEAPNESWVGMLRAAFLSFAINLPAVANAQVASAFGKLKSPKWSKEWCIGMLKALTFGAKIGIYPARYLHIKKTLETCWNVTLPSAKELSDWVEPAVVIEELIPDPVVVKDIVLTEDTQKLVEVKGEIPQAIVKVEPQQENKISIFEFIMQLLAILFGRNKT